MTDKPNPSTTSLQSTTTFNSTSPLGQPTQRRQKDYATALTVLQSRYGTGGANVPSPKKEPSKKLPENSQTASSPSQPASTSEISVNTSQTTLTESSSVTSETSASGGSSSTGEQRRKSKGKKSILKSLFKGKAKES